MLHEIMSKFNTSKERICELDIYQNNQNRIVK